MGRKHKHPEHVNLERYLISYADFITLLFATFVVLYALSQVDIKDFQSLEKSMQEAFAAPSLMQGSEGVMNESSDSLFDTSQADSMIAPLMMEYMSQKYEEESMQEIQKNINKEIKDGEIDGVEAIRTEKGLMIRFNDDYLFKSGSAELNSGAKTKLDKVGLIIGKKFVLHIMRVDGHTDNQPIKSVIFPSNWELSSARASSIIRYFISRFDFMPGLFSAVGLADTRPIGDNSTPEGRAKNRRIEILILKNKFRSQEAASNEVVKMTKEQQEELQRRRIETISRIGNISQAAKNLAQGDKKAEANAIILNQAYHKEITRINKETRSLDKTTREKVLGEGLWLKQPAKEKFKLGHE